MRQGTTSRGWDGISTLRGAISGLRADNRPQESDLDGTLKIAWILVCTSKTAGCTGPAHLKPVLAPGGHKNTIAKKTCKMSCGSERSSLGPYEVRYLRGAG